MFSSFLGFSLLISIFAPLDAQSYGCNSSWILTPNTGAYGGTVQPSVTTETGCRAACYANINCTGIDWNSGNNVGNQCFLQYSSGVRFSGSGINHWEFNRTAPCAGACGSWNLTSNTGVYGGSESNATSEDDCKKRCENQNGCVGVDWNSNNPDGKRCYQLTNTGPRYSAQGVNHWDYNATAGCASPCGQWTSAANTGQFGGIVQPSVTSEMDCKKACENNNTCFGVDWNANNPQGQQCFMLFGSGQLFSGNGVTHWQFNRSGNCSSPCGSWARQDNTGQYGGTVQSSYTYQEDCKKACESNPTCFGVDWNANSPQGQQCFHLFSRGTTYSGSGITHWEYQRGVNCSGNSGSSMPWSVTPTQGPTGAAVSTFSPLPNCFTPYYGMNIFGGTENTAATLEICKSRCLAMPFNNCQSIDWVSSNPVGRQCYILNTQTGRNPANWGVDHYDRSSTC